MTTNDYGKHTICQIEVPGVSQYVLSETPVVELTMTESILTPGLQTRAIIQDPIGGFPERRNLDEFQGQPVRISLSRPWLDTLPGYDGPSTITTVQRIYRIGNRKQLNRGVQSWHLDICDPSLLNDANMLVSRSWQKATPSQVVSDVLRGCIKAKNVQIESSGPARDYIAENIHPFQVCSQQSDVALAGNDPSFLHYMTFKNGSTHHFESFKTMSKKAPILGGAQFIHSEPEHPLGRFINPFNMIKYEFPCDFDNLTDVLNGVVAGTSLRSLQSFNPANGVWSNFGNSSSSCGIGGATALAMTTNSGTASQQNSSDISVEKYALLRQARLMLLEPDKVALRFSTSFNPALHAGDVINVKLINRGTGTGAPRDDRNYGTGKYLISSMSHTWKRDGYATTEVDCVSYSVSIGKT